MLREQEAGGSIPLTPTAAERQKGWRVVTHVESTRTLLLTQGYEPIQIISWQRAMTLLALDKVDVVEQYDAEIRAASIMLRVPAVVRLRKLFHRAPKPVKF